MDNIQSSPIFSILDSIDSTNNYATGMVHAGMAKHGMAWFARFQTAGKGQRSKQWESEQDSNIMMSVVLQTNDYRLEKTYAFNAVVAVACCSFLQNISGENFKIKWPNDLMWRDRKAGGILIENIIRGNDWLWSVVGTGLNINQHKFTNIDTAVSVRQITGKTYDVVELAKQLQNCLIEAVEKSASGNMAVYNELLYKKGEQVTFKKDSIVFTGIVDHVDEYGQLYLSDHPESISFGEVRWLLR